MDYRIVAAIINCFYERLRPDKPEHETIAKAMLARVKTVNKLQSIVDRKKLIISKYLTSLSSVKDFSFPRFSRDDLQMNITFGVYQVYEALGYIDEHLRKNNDEFMVSVSEDFTFESADTRVVHTKLSSRHKYDLDFDLKGLNLLT